MKGMFGKEELVVVVGFVVVVFLEGCKERGMKSI